MFSQERQFTVFISATEYKHLCNWVLKFEHLETGGDLFGLWLDKHTAVMQLVLGPGKGCRRTGTSFYQDVQYLGDVGSYLTHKEGLCHIGEWHSHHKLGLTRPSGGDENTVWSNMPSYGLSRFVLFIATIGRENAVNVGCFLFETDTQTKRQYPVLQGNFQLLPDYSPFRLKAEVSQVIKEKAESLNTDVDLLEIKKSKTDFLVSKPRRVAEKASKQKRIWPNRSTESVDERSGEEPQPKRTPPGEYGRFYNEKEESGSGDSHSVPSNHQSRFTDEQQHPFSPDNHVEAMAAKKDGRHVLTSGDDLSRKHHQEVEDQGNIHNSSQAPTPESGKGTTLVRSDKDHRNEKRKTRDHANATAVQLPSPGVAGSSNTADQSVPVTDEPGTPSGTYRHQERSTFEDDDSAEEKAGTWSVIKSLFTCGTGSSKRKPK